NRFDHGQANLPVYRFRARAAEGIVEVEYRYFINDVEARSWTAISPAVRDPTGDHLALELSYQTLDARLSSAPSDLHPIELRAIDAQGNTSTIAARFRVVLLSPPVWFGACAMDPELGAYSLAAGNLERLYDGTSRAVLVGQVRYALDLPKNSHAPSSPLLVSAVPGAIRTRVVAVGEDRHDAMLSFYNPWNDTFRDPTNYCWYGFSKIGPDDQHLSDCLEPETPADHVARTATLGSALNDDDSHQGAVLAFDPSGRSALM